MALVERKTRLEPVTPRLLDRHELVVLRLERVGRL